MKVHVLGLCGDGPEQRHTQLLSPPSLQIRQNSSEATVEDSRKNVCHRPFEELDRTLC